MVSAARFRLDDLLVQEDPYPYYPGLRDHEPVLRTDLGGRPVWVLSRHGDVTSALRDPGTFSSRTTPAPTVLHADPPDQQRLRAMVSGMFSRSAVGPVGPFVAQRSAELLDPLVGAGACDVVDDLAGPLTVSVIGRVLGIAVDDVERLRHLTRLTQEHVRSTRLGHRSPPEAKAASEQLLGFTADIVTSGRFRGEGVVARLADLAARGELSGEECAHYVLLLLVAGHTTTTNLLANSVATLAARPDDLARMRTDPTFVPAFVEEVLRTRPSFQRILRVTTRDVEVSGTTIPAGATVYLLLGSANRDPAAIDAPEQVDPDRRRTPHVTFGHGIHTCLGQWLARLEARTALTAFAQRVSAVRLDPDAPAERLSGGTMNEYGFEHLPVRLEALPPGTRTGSAGATAPRESETAVRVEAKHVAADGVVVLDLGGLDGKPFPPWEAGAHVDLVLDAAPTRQYSLCGDPQDRATLRIGVLRDPDGSGSSRHVHDALEVGDVVRVRGPRNHFPLEPSPRYLFIAGGIGITPILPMIAAAQAAGSDWRLVYAGRRRTSMAFLPELAAHGSRVSVRPKDESGPLDLDELLGTPQDGTLVYCCGPERLLAAVEARCAGWPAGAVNVERFHPRPLAEAAPTEAFEVVLERSGLTLPVPADRSVLDVVEAAGVDVLSSCREGTCGTCEVRVLGGAPDHRDSVLGEVERASGQATMICVSRSTTPHLVLDL